MERQAIFLQSLLVLMVLVVAIQVISACKCGKQRTMEESICRNETLVMATPESKSFADKDGNPVSDEHLAYYVIYKTLLNVMYHEGLNKLSETQDYFELVTPRKPSDCGVPFKTDTPYYITGTARGDNLLLVDSCDYAAPVPWDLSHKEFEFQNDLLTRHIKVDCSKLRRGLRGIFCSFAHSNNPNSFEENYLTGNDYCYFIHKRDIALCRVIPNLGVKLGQTLLGGTQKTAANSSILICGRKQM